eukprot:scaffold3282_cov65-Phaeocystis_antarctica.AAC.1
MSGYHPATVRRAGCKRGARLESAEALAEQPAVARRCRALRRSSVNILTAWPGRVAQAPRAGRARSLVLLTMLKNVGSTSTRKPVAHLLSCVCRARARNTRARAAARAPK